MEKTLRTLAVATLGTVFAAPLAANPVDLTGLACSRTTNFGLQTWEFYGDVAIRYYSDGTVSSLPRIGPGAYERYNDEGNWRAVYYFFDLGDGVQFRILSRPGLAVREENPLAPLDRGVFKFNAECKPIWENQ